MYICTSHLFFVNSDEHTSLCELGPRDPTKNLTSMVPKDQMSVLREIHSGRTSLQDMGKDVWGEGGGGGGSMSEEMAQHTHYLQSPVQELATHTHTHSTEHMNYSLAQVHINHLSTHHTEQNILLSHNTP